MLKFSEVTMTALKGTTLVLFASVFLTLPSAAQADNEKKANKEKPKDAATLNDEEQVVTTTVDGKTKTKKIDLTYYLQVTGYFAKNGFHIEKLTPGGPAARLMDDSGNDWRMDPGDIIVEVDGKKVASPEAYAKAINAVTDHEKIKLKIKDKNTGNDVELYASARKR
jgi:S1-C subfamily serine protease